MLLRVDVNFYDGKVNFDTRIEVDYEEGEFINSWEVLEFCGRKVLSKDRMRRTKDAILHNFSDKFITSKIMEAVESEIEKERMIVEEDRAESIIMDRMIYGDRFGYI